MHPLIETTNHIANISCELYNQDEKWGPQAHSMQKWMVLLVEEIGELAQEINNIGMYYQPAYDEAMQAASLLIRIMNHATICIKQEEAIWLDRLEAQREILAEC